MGPGLRKTTATDGNMEFNVGLIIENKMKFGSLYRDAYKI
jgi:hypothetical protein